MTTHRLRDVALVLTSNVDKVIDPDEHPVRLCNYVDVYKNNFIHNEMPFKLGSATAAEIKKFRVEVDDVIITKDSETADDIGVPALVKSTADDLVCGYHLSILRADRRRMIGPFLFWHLLSKKTQEDFGNAANGVTRYGLTLGGIKCIPVNVPDLATQRQIADFLDRETARIDLLIEKKQRLVALLGEKRSSIIMDAVTGGRDRRFATIGDRVSADGSRFAKPLWASVLPSEWQVLPIKKIVSTPITDGPHETPEFLDEGVVFISAEAIQDGKIDFARRRGFISEAENRRYSRKYSPETGDIYVVKSGATTGKSAMVGEDTDFNIWSPLAVIRSKSSMDGRFVLHTIRSAIVQDAIAINWSWGTQQNIGMGALGRIQVPVPDLATQRQIADFLDRETARIDVIEERTTTSIDRLKEYRSALITAAVTGQIDVTTYAKSGTPDPALCAIQEEMGA